MGHLIRAQQRRIGEVPWTSADEVPYDSTVTRIEELKATVRQLQRRSCGQLQVMPAQPDANQEEIGKTPVSRVIW